MSDLNGIYLDRIKLKSASIDLTNFFLKEKNYKKIELYFLNIISIIDNSKLSKNKSLELLLSFKKLKYNDIVKNQIIELFNRYY
jgi:hypothetical protein